MTSAWPGRIGDPAAAQVVRVPLPDKGDAEFVADLLVFDAERTLGRTQP